MIEQIRWRQCNVCGEMLPEKFFPIRSRRSGMYTYQKTYRDAKCMGCRDKRKDEKKKRNRWTEKARNAIYHHADRAIRRRVIKSRSAFRELFGWTVPQLAHDFEFQYDNGCSICHHPYSEMGHGPADITIDITNPNILPFYETNKQFVCMTCNRRKQRTNPEDYGEVMLGWRLWKTHQAKYRNSQWAGLPLFEAMGID